MPPLKYSLFIQTTGQTISPGGIARVAEAADEMGFDTAWIGDHVVVPETIESRYPFTRSGAFPMKYSDNFLEPLSTITYVLSKTRRLRAGTNVLIVPYRNPVYTAKALATMDWLSEGRLTVGVGVGWMREEFEALDAESYDERGRVTDEYLDIFHKLWTEELVSHEGEYYSFKPLYAQPQPVQRPHPPFYVGGHAPVALRRAARIGSGWNAWRLGPDELPPYQERLAGYLRDAGRSPDDVKICVTQLLAVTDGAASPAGPDAKRPALTGTVEQIVEDLKGYAAAGVEQVAFLLRAGTAEDTVAQLERFKRDIQPKVGV